MVLPNYPKLQQIFAEKGYAFFRGKYNLNMIGIRSEDRTPNKFDDLLIIAYQDANNTPILFITECTVDPGLPWIRSPMDTGGAAAIYPGQYRGVWKLGSFRNQPALIQVRNFKIYRDNNRDDVLDYTPEKTTVGLYGILYHPHFQSIDPAPFVNNSSAGCVVPASNKAFATSISLVDKQNKIGYGDTVTFTLFDAADFEKK